MKTEGNATTDTAKAVLLIRERLGIGRRHFSAKLDCSYFTLRIWETGKNEPNALYLLKLLSIAELPDERDPLVNALARRGVMLSNLTVRS
jgi:DNA-binding transcriptional regulator YiaG